MRVKSFSRSPRKPCASVLVLAIIFGIKANGNQSSPRENAWILKLQNSSKPAFVAPKWLLVAMRGVWKLFIATGLLFSAHLSTWLLYWCCFISHSWMTYRCWNYLAQIDLGGRKKEDLALQEAYLGVQHDGVGRAVWFRQSPGLYWQILRSLQKVTETRKLDFSTGLNSL